MQEISYFRILLGVWVRDLGRLAGGNAGCRASWEMWHYQTVGFWGLGFFGLYGLGFRVWGFWCFGVRVFRGLRVFRA